MNASTQPVRPYAVTSRPGYFGQNKTQVFSAHATLKAAKKAAGSGYVDEAGRRKHPLCVVYHPEGWTKGEVIWGDMFPQVVC